MPSDLARRKKRVLFLYWGRRGSASRLLFDVGQAALRSHLIDPFISVSRQNENFEEFAVFDEALVPVETFAQASGALTRLWRLPSLRRDLAATIRRHEIDVVVTLMPHVWTPLVVTAVKQAGARYFTVVHDAVAHPGDRTSLVLGWLSRDAVLADGVIALSGSVAAALAASGRVRRDNVFVTHLPDLDYGVVAPLEAPAPGEPWRLLFLGRILRYKGLDLCLDAVEEMRRQGLNVHLGVYGEGDLGPNAARLRAIGADVVNRWLSEAEIADLLKRHHIVLLTHIEASQSGVASTAFAAGLPVVATPVGGLVEQVRNGQTGMLAQAATASAIADAARVMFEDPSLYRRIRLNLAASAEARSADRFVEDLAHHLFDDRSREPTSRERDHGGAQTN